MQLVHPVSFKLSGGLLNKPLGMCFTDTQGLQSEAFMMRILIEPDHESGNISSPMYTHTYGHTRRTETQTPRAGIRTGTEEIMNGKG